MDPSQHTRAAHRPRRLLGSRSSAVPMPLETFSKLNVSEILKEADGEQGPEATTKQSADKMRELHDEYEGVPTRANHPATPLRHPATHRGEVALTEVSARRRSRRWNGLNGL